MIYVNIVDMNYIQKDVKIVLMKLIKRYLLLEYNYYRLLEALEQHEYSRAKTLIVRRNKMNKIMLSVKQLVILLLSGVIGGIALSLAIFKYLNII